MHTISVVIPVYGGRTSLAGVVAEILPLTSPSTTAVGRHFRVAEILLVDDNGPDGSADVIRALAADHPQVVRPVWLSRNFGQHAASLAGMASSGSDWVATLDEDGRQVLRPAVKLDLDADRTEGQPGTARANRTTVPSS